VPTTDIRTTTVSASVLIQVEIFTQTRELAQEVAAIIEPITATPENATAFLRTVPGLEATVVQETVPPAIVETAAGPSTPPPPPPLLGECSAWCNAYTCDLYFCRACQTCADLRVGNYCAGWCNDWTSWSEYCTGCTVSAEAQARCYTDWCNVYICGLTNTCSGCGFCTDLTSGTHCSPWCNPFTSWSSYCSGCP
jgi:hypothetical protein